MNQVAKKFTLLLWKNYILQKRHKVQTAVEIFIPLLFTLILLIIRGVVDMMRYKDPTTYPAFDPINDVNYTVIPYGRYVLYTPDTGEALKLMEAVKLKFEDAGHKTYSFVGFSDEKALMNAYQNEVTYTSQPLLQKKTLEKPENENPVLAAVVFKKWKSDNIKYQIRFPASLHAASIGENVAIGLKPRWLTEFLYEFLPLPRDRDHIVEEDEMSVRGYKERGGRPGYWKQGFLFLQRTIDTEIIRMKAVAVGKDKDAVDQFTVQLNRYPYPPFIDDNFVTVLQLELPFFLMLSFLYPINNIAKSIAHEKERRLKESMKIMGLPNWLHWSAWFTKSFAFLFISTIILTLIYKIPWYEDGLGILSYASPTLLFVFLISYTFSTITLGFLVSTFFSTANSASTASGVVFFVTYFPYIFLRPRYNKLTKGLKLSMCVISNTAMALGCHLIAVFEGTGAGIQWSTISEGVSPDDTFTLLEVILMLWLNGSIYLMLAIYVEAVCPGEYGIPLPWNFPFTKWYWLGTPRGGVVGDIAVHPSLSEASHYEKHKNVFEKEPNGFAGIQILGLTKIFGKKVAVDDLHLNFYENQVTALLGHNGAGKTTTMSMLTGLFPPTSGTAIVNGYDIRKDIKSVRGSLGLCPQHDVLFDEMTVEEHLRFFCLLKGVRELFVPAEIDRMLGVLMLENKRHAQSRTLSGGMKRKLSVGIALIGDSKVVLLDEPTSGMDPSARRSTWDLITNEKKGRTVVLSTHFMDEADLLGDRIAIMAEGQVQCCGSSLFLKKKYGGGYHLIIVKQADCKVNQITELLRKRIPEIQVDQNIGTELSYSLPDEKSSVFPAMFEELESRKNDLGIASYGCSITQMEEVFMRVGQQMEEEMNRRKFELQTSNETLSQLPSSAVVISSYDVVNDKPKVWGEKLKPPAGEEDIKSLSSNFEMNISNTSENGGSSKSFDNTNQASSVELGVPEDHGKLDEDVTSKTALFQLLLQQFRAMLVKKWLHAVRNKLFLIGQIFVPVIFLNLVLIMLKTLPDITTPVERVIDLNQYSRLGKIPITTVHCEHENTGVCQTYIRLAKEKSTVRTTSKMFNEYILEQSKKSLPRVNFKYITGLETTNSDKTLTGFFNNQPLHSPPVALNLITNAILREVTGNDKSTLTVSNYPLPTRSSDNVDNLIETEHEGFHIGLNISFGMSFFAAGLVVFVIKERETKSKHLQFVSGVRFPIFWLAHFIFDAVYFVIPILILMTILLAYQQKDYKEGEMLGCFFIVLLCYGWAVIPLMYLFSFLFTVPSSGYTRLSFFNALTGMATLLTIAILKLESLGLTKIANKLEWVFMVFPNFDVGYALWWLTMNKQLHIDCPKFLRKLLEIQKEQIRKLGPIANARMHDIKSICSIEQSLAFPAVEQCCKHYPISYLSWDSPGIGRNIVFLFLIGSVSFVILFIIESNIVQRIKYTIETKRFAQRAALVDPDILEDDDVAAENDRIRGTSLPELFQTENMVLKDLTKYYNGFLAVDRLCLGVQPGQCFGLLGVNGAGKTTTFKMLTGDIPITSGHAYIATRSVKAEIKRVQKVLGYCPQFDALIPELTGRETIRLFARLRGIPEGRIDNLADELGKNLLFSQFMDKSCGKYSGGNKRKLSTALALVGNPPLVFLDEPTTGMDPCARTYNPIIEKFAYIFLNPIGRHLWNTIISVREKGASVILTSHSMEECEALCTRLAIMVNGRFRCLGSTQHLKNKFGDGYTLIAQIGTSIDDQERKLRRTSIELGRRQSSLIENRQEWEQELKPLRIFIEESFPGCVLKEIHPFYVHYHINDDEGMTWGKIFRKMEEAKALFRLEAYSVGQTSLEQVFLGFTQEQAELIKN